MSAYHEPVLLRESVDRLDVRPDGVYVDVTFGGGGHSREILSRLGRRGHLIAFDQDSDALENAPEDKRITLIHNNFRFLHGCVRAAGFEHVDGILADLGVSSHHFDTPERGFSFRFDGPLDMRMNRHSGTPTAADLLNTSDVDRLATLFGRYGELDKCYRIATAIVRHRETAGPFAEIGDLLRATESVTPRGSESRFRARLFQALRIEVNGEMQALEMMLSQAIRLLKPGGRLSVITYHSLEDRLTKNFMRSGTPEGIVVRDFYGQSSTPVAPVGKVILPAAAEIDRNPRARSAKLRVAERTGQQIRA
ncbi:16S rRNA (cytosine(1402)-N(4))-methyltransferase RsmH [uncultured Rikenella sp.]|uniref:16S rRNA (cytosine(1402)-N(4))-methyltransferase RsmH n=1 Tax=uncultured Rikenella sp. TaxID=368003 RepID=UPI0025D20231|nr:16S rRNA (cytosine(1402)-N(4))-methyltransferase RsmH [uncultured Rikenella sp.]